MTIQDPKALRAILAASLLVVGLAAAGCSRTQQPVETASGDATAQQPETEATPDATAAPTPAPAPAHKPPASQPPATTTPATPPPPPAPEAAKFTMVKVSEGKNIPITMETGMSSKTSTVGQPITAKVTTDVGTKAHPATVIPAGSVLKGTVTEVQKAKQMSGNARIAFKFDTLTLPAGDSYEVMATLVEQGENTKSRTAKGAGGGAAAGAIIGTIIGRDAKGALIGGAAGAAIGTGVVASMDNKDVEIPAGAELIVELGKKMEIKVPTP